MKNNSLILMVLFITAVGCNLTTNKSKKSSGNHIAPTQLGAKKFFNYDEIDYYFNDYDESKLIDLYDNQSKSKLDSFKKVIILGNTPKTIFDLAFIEKLEIIGYKKCLIDKSKFADFDRIFSEKSDTGDYEVSACIYVYRDILIFKKSNKVIGIAKISFCGNASEITGTKADTKFFGQNGDYERLYKLLHE